MSYVGPDHQRTFREVLGQFPTGVVIVCTIEAANRPVGFTISSFCSLSLNPPLVMFCLNADSPSLPALHATRRFSVNVLASDQSDLSTRFSRWHEDKFTGVDWNSGRSGVPVISGAAATIECSLWDEYPGGDHVVVVGHVHHMEADEGADPLVFHKGRYRALERTGHVGV